MGTAPGGRTRRVVMNVATDQVRRKVRADGQPRGVASLPLMLDHAAEDKSALYREAAWPLRTSQRARVACQHCSHSGALVVAAKQHAASLA